jgi:hypothetical protein
VVQIDEGKIQSHLDEVAQHSGRDVERAAGCGSGSVSPSVIG